MLLPAIIFGSAVGKKSHRRIKQNCFQMRWFLFYNYRCALSSEAHRVFPVKAGWRSASWWKTQKASLCSVLKVFHCPLLLTQTHFLSVRPSCCIMAPFVCCLSSFLSALFKCKHMQLWDYEATKRQSAEELEFYLLLFLFSFLFLSQRC